MKWNGMSTTEDRNVGSGRSEYQNVNNGITEFRNNDIN